MKENLMSLWWGEKVNKFFKVWLIIEVSCRKKKKNPQQHKNITLINKTKKNTFCA